MSLLNRVLAASLLVARACAACAGALRYVYHETLIPVDYGNIVWADFDGDKRRDLAYCGATSIFHTNCSDFPDRNKKGETKTVVPSGVFACQPDRVSFADRTATAHKNDPQTSSWSRSPERRNGYE